MPSALFLGATGYIGSAVFNAFINAHPAFDYITLVRTPAHSSHIRTVNTVIGTLEDRELLVNLAREADIVVNVARADDLAMVEAIVEGLRRRKEEDGKVSAFIHTCGGNSFVGRDVWDDVDEECVRALLARPVEQALLHAEQQGVLHAYFIAPEVVYGLNPYDKPSPFYLQLIRELLSLPEPPALTLPFSSVKLTDAPDRMLGSVHIDDLAGLYLLVLDKFLQYWSGFESLGKTKPPHVYIVSSSERSSSSVFRDVHRALTSRGFTPSLEGSTENVHPNPHLLPHRAFDELGWTPTHSEWQHDIKGDIDRALDVLKVNRSSTSSSTKSA